MSAPLVRRTGDAGVPIGTFVKLASLEAAEIVALAGFDFVVIDAEHAPLSVRDVYHLVVTYSAFGVDALVRLPDHGYRDGQRYLDAGAAGLFLPHVTSPDEAAAAMRSFMFPPEGTRGMGYAARAGGWGLRDGGIGEYLRAGRQDVRRVAMIEDANAVAAVEGIATSPGVDAIFVGAADLALSMGLAQRHPDVLAAVDHVIARCVAASVPVGALVADPESASVRAAQGCSYLMTSSDAALLARAAARAVRGLRRACSEPDGT